MKLHIQTLMASATIAVVVGVSGASAEIVLRFNNFVPRTSGLFTGITQPWAKRVEEATEGRVKIEFTASGIGSPRATFDLVKDGVVHVAMGVAAYTPDRLKLTQIAELPLVGDSSEAISVALWDVYQAHFEEAGEFDGIKLLGFAVPVPGHIFTLKGPQETLADFAGLKLRVAGPVPGALAEAFGAIPVAAPGPKAAELLNSGVIDGTFFATEGLFDFGLQKVISSGTIFPKGLFSVVFYLVMNESTWDNLSTEDQAAIESVSYREFSIASGRSFDEQNRKALEDLKAMGVTITTAPDEMISIAKEIAEDLQTKWAETAETERNVDGASALKMFQEKIDSYSK